MKLYLSSFRLGNHPVKVLEISATKRAAVVCNACDLLSQADRAASVQFEMETLQSLGFAAQELDLRHYYDSPSAQGLQERLRSFGLVWVRGGNTFVLRRAMRTSGFDSLVIAMLERNEIAYAGYSAGVCVLAPSLKGLELADDPHSVPDGLNPAIIWDGLGLLPYAVAPHYRSNHPESEAVEKLVQFYQEYGIPHRTLRDGEAIIVNGDETYLVC